MEIKIFQFYYSQIMRTFSWSLQYNTYSKSFYDYHVTTLKTIHPITFQNYTKHSIRVLGNKNNMYMQPFSKTLPTIHLNIFVPNVFNKRNLPEIQDKKKLYLAFNHVKDSVSSKKNAVRWIIKQNCE